MQHQIPPPASAPAASDPQGILDLGQTPGEISGRYNSSTKTLTISGIGILSREKFKNQVNEVYNDPAVTVIFEGGPASRISLPADSSALFSRYNGYFNKLNYTLRLPDNLDTSHVTNMQHIFNNLTSQELNVSHWDTSHVTRMEYAFYGTKALVDVAAWDTSQTVDMSNMFSLTSSDPNVSQWNTSQVRDISGMFYNNPIANPDVSRWDTSNVTNMRAVFSFARNANPDVSNWNTSRVTTMRELFSVSSFDGDVSRWDTSQVTDMARMFSGAIVANPDVSRWDTSQVTDMARMFSGAIVANPNVSDWNTTSIEDMSYMFERSYMASPDLSRWQTPNLKRAAHALEFTGADATPDQTQGGMLLFNISSLDLTHLEEGGLPSIINRSVPVALILTKDQAELFKNKYSKMQFVQKPYGIYDSEGNLITDGTNKTVWGDQVISIIEPLLAHMRDGEQYVLRPSRMSDIIDSNNPVPVPVDDIAHVSDDEKTQVQDAIIVANRDMFPANTAIDVAEDGTATITYPDGSTMIFDPSKTVLQKLFNEKYRGSGKVSVAYNDVVRYSEIVFTPELPLGSKVVDLSSVDTQVSGDKQAVATVQFSDGSSGHVSVTVTVLPSTATTIRFVDPQRTSVVDPTNLTPEEKQQVEDAVRTANNSAFPENTTIQVADNGEVTVTYPDGSQTRISPEKTVVGSSQADKITTTGAVEVPRHGVVDATTITFDPALPEGSQVTELTTVDTSKPGTTYATATIRFADGSITKVPVTVTVLASMSDRITLNKPAKTPVKNLNQVDEKERQIIAQAVADVNEGILPQGSAIEVYESGDVQVNLPDGSQIHIDKTDTIMLDSSIYPTVEDDKDISSEDVSQISTVDSAALPNTGSGIEPLVASGLTIGGSIILGAACLLRRKHH